MLQLLLRYTAVGAVNTVVGLLAMWAVQYFLSFRAAQANAFGYLVGIALSFWLNRTVVFRGGTNAREDVVPFLMLAAIAYCCNMLALLLLTGVAKANAYLAQAFAVATYAGIMFLGLRWWSMRKVGVAPALVAPQLNPLLQSPLPQPHGISLWSRRDSLLDGRAYYWLTVLAAVLYFIIGYQNSVRNAKDGQFYQAEFAPAVMFACEGKLLNIHGNRSVTLSRFLTNELQVLDCSNVFPLTNGATSGPLNIHQLQTLGLLYTYGWAWKLFGINWSATHFVCGILYAAYFLGLACVGRLLLPGVIGLAAAIAVIQVESIGGQYLVHVRDFSKAPFIILLLHYSATLLERSRREIVPICVGLAVLLSLGLGFRSDVLVFQWIILGLIMVRAVVWRAEWIRTVTALFAFISVMALFKWFVFDWSEGVGRNLYHFFFLGQTEPFHQRLGMGPSDIMLGHHYNDSVAHQLTSMYARATKGILPGYATSQYDAAGREEFLSYIAQFPADALSRAVSAACDALMGGLLASPTGQAVLLLSVGSVLIWKLRLRGITIFAGTVILAGMSSVQYDPRHFFVYRAIGSLLLLAAVVIVSLAIVERLLERLRVSLPRHQARVEPEEVLAICSASRLLVWMPLAGAAVALVLLPVFRLHQNRVVARIMEGLAKSPTLVVIKANADTAIDMSLLKAALQEDGARYARFTFDTMRPDCKKRLSIHLRYEATLEFFNWTYLIQSRVAGVATIFTPILQVSQNTLQDIKLSIDSSCLMRFELIALPPATIPQTYVLHANPATDRFWVSASAEHELEPLPRRIGFALSRHHCQPRSTVVRGKQVPIREEREIKLPSYIRFRVDDGGDNVHSDHVNIVSPKVLVGNTTWPLSEFEVADKKTTMFQLQIGSNILRKPLRLDGVAYADGFGVHAPAEFTLRVPPALIGKHARLYYAFGIDDQTAGAGSAALTVCDLL